MCSGHRLGAGTGARSSWETSEEEGEEERRSEEEEGTLTRTVRERSSVWGTHGNEVSSGLQRRWSGVACVLCLPPWPGDEHLLPEPSLGSLGVSVFSLSLLVRTPVVLEQGPFS